MFKKLIIYSLFFTLFSLSGCGLEIYQNGDLPSENRMKLISVGNHSKEQIQRMLGAPSIIDERENVFIYAKIRKKSQAFLEPKEFERDVYVYSFDDKNMLKDIEHFTFADHINIPYNDNKTKTQYRELSIADQLIRNFGRYDSGGVESTTRH